MGEGKQEMVEFTGDKVAGRVAIGDSCRHVVTSHRRLITGLGLTNPLF